LVKKTLREHLQSAFSEDDLVRWYDPLRIDLDETQKQLIVVFPHPLFAEWFGQSVRDKFEEHVSHFLGPGYAIGYGDGRPRSRTVRTAPPVKAKQTDFPFGHQFTFERFLVNKKNYFPLASAREVSKKGRVVFNPFIICGEPGSGKTHLLRAIANEIARGESREAIYLGSIDDVRNVFAGQEAFKARQYFQQFHYLFVDDFQAIEAYPDLQQEIISLFNHFHDEKKQMIFTCLGKLASYRFLDPKLKSRLEWGLIVTLKKPDLDIRVQHIQNQIKQKQITLSNEQVLTLAQHFQDFRYLQGILLKLFAFKELVNKDISDEDFKRVLANTEDKPQTQLRPELIIQVVADHFDMDTKLIKSTKRHHKVVQARQTAMYLCRTLLGSSYPSLGRIFGGKDHSTVLYAVNKMKQLQQDSEETKDLLITLREKCLASGEG
jgi:chromosomal replication initiator protein